MKLYEFCTPSDPITFYAPDNDIAEAIGLYIGNGKAGIELVDGGEVPYTLIAFTGFSDGQEERYQKTMDERINEFIDAAHTFAVCPPAYRQEYDELTKNSTDIERVKQWDDKHRSSMSDWCTFARNLKLKKAEHTKNV